jgi:hypothetical protein
MISRSTLHTLTLALLLAVGAAGAGPAEVSALETELATVDAQIAETQGLMKRALEGYGGDPGEQGIRLRTLKRERGDLDRRLQAARKSEDERAGRANSVPSQGSTRRPAPPIATGAPAPAAR